MGRRVVIRRQWLYMVAIGLGGLALASCSSDPPEPITVLAGINDPDDFTIGVTEYLPESITISAGTTVTWKLDGPEPHTVSFNLTGLPRPQVGFFTFDPLPVTGPYDGTARISSGLEPRTDPVEFVVQFDQPGEYEYFCVIHGGMNGTVTVVDGEGETQAAIDARASAEAEQWLAEGREAKAAFVAQAVESQPAEGGSTEWFVRTGMETEHTTILAFSPQALDIEPGDIVTFVNNSAAPHTATFLAGEPPVPWFDPRVFTVVRPPGQPAPLSLSEYASSGELFPGAGARHSYDVSEPGVYSYVCLLHLPSQMVGSFTASG